MEEYNIRLIRFLNKYLQFGDKIITEYIKERNIELGKYTKELRKLKEQAINNLDRDIIILIDKVSDKSRGFSSLNAIKRRSDKEKNQSLENAKRREEALNYIMEQIENGHLVEAIDYYQGPYRDVNIISLYFYNINSLTKEQREKFNEIFKAERYYRQNDDPMPAIDSIVSIKLGDELHVITEDEKKHVLSEMKNRGIPYKTYLYKQLFRRIYDASKINKTK